MLAAMSALPPAAVKSVKVVKDKVAGSAIEIVTSRPVPPALQTLPNPPRLVIDLPNANVALKQKEIAGKGEQFTNLHVDQFQASPPVTRVTVDLAEAKPYTWDAAGNRVTIRLKPPEDPKAKATPPPPAQPATVSTLGSTTQPPVVPVASRPTGSAVIAGSRIGNGSSITASAETAVLHIARGGELHVCPGSTVSVTASKNTQDLMFGMSTGTLETHYHLEAASDAVLTPDFRMLLSGPGDFNYAISANSHGDTCVRALLGNTASLLVSELMGDRTYQVKPTEQVVFHEGRIDRVSNDVPFDCGCAAPPPPVMLASAEPVTQPVSEKNVPPNVQLPSSSTAAPAARAVLDPMLPPLPNASRPAVATIPSTQPGSVTSARAETAPPPRTKPSDIHVQIEAPLVFRGGDRPKATTTTAANMPPPAPSAKPRSDPTAPIPQPVPPPKPAVQEQPKPKEHHGFFGRVKGFFSSVFH
jgi:AMIN domain-containing protein